MILIDRTIANGVLDVLLGAHHDNAPDLYRHIFGLLDADPLPSEVTRQLIERDAHGQRKYGTSLDRTDLNLGDWLQHQAEELMDGAGYALAAKREYEALMALLREAILLYDTGLITVKRGNLDDRIRFGKWIIEVQGAIK